MQEQAGKVTGLGTSPILLTTGCIVSFRQDRGITLRLAAEIGGPDGFASPGVGAEAGGGAAAGPFVGNLIGVVGQAPVVGIFVVVGLGGEVEDQGFAGAQVLQAMPDADGD